MDLILDKRNAPANIVDPINLANTAAEMAGDLVKKVERNRGTKGSVCRLCLFGGCFRCFFTSFILPLKLRAGESRT